MERDLDVVVLRQTVADLLDVVERVRKRAVGCGHVRDVFAEKFYLTKCLIELGVFVGDVVQVLRGLLKISHCVGRFRGDGSDHFQHFGGGFTNVGIAFAGKHLTIACASRSFGALSNVYRHIAE